jgi:hypothetical protein
MPYDCNTAFVHQVDGVGRVEPPGFLLTLLWPVIELVIEEMKLAATLAIAALAEAEQSDVVAAAYGVLDRLSPSVARYRRPGRNPDLRAGKLAPPPANGVHLNKEH